MSYHSFIRSMFGSHHQLHIKYVYSLQLYSLFIVTLTICLCMYTVQRYKITYDKSFEDRVHGLRVKYSTTERIGYD
jgi:hypothetical protein